MPSGYDLPPEGPIVLDEIFKRYVTYRIICMDSPDEPEVLPTEFELVQLGIYSKLYQERRDVHKKKDQFMDEAGQQATALIEDGIDPHTSRAWPPNLQGGEASTGRHEAQHLVIFLGRVIFRVRKNAFSSRVRKKEQGCTGEEDALWI